eukprot:CAMPEP_0203774594 /NCGR_PEP_ID=MMETSP0099_2-20121227/5452_1 /ASSEMBLY_ACC=CAM_ASM_000209 /TAXON_ID=96639 /ORGANISM=" , Strain NY0313808BC1" /LENGTH=353 /DNA_ID=CAMNT_0050672857 /DNA_START=389 /DNA_END=1450 /DNA_ORIENTATION=+
MQSKVGGKKDMRVLSDDIIRKHLQTWKAVRVNQMAFQMLERGEVNVPKRLIQKFDGFPGTSLFKPCSFPGDEGAFGIKMIHVRPDNGPRGLPTTPATIMLFDKLTGAPECLMNGTYLTALRTAAGSAVATEKVSREDSSNLVVFGAGLQGEAHIKTICCVRAIRSVTIINRGEKRAAELASQLTSDLAGMVRNEAGDVLGDVPTFSVVTTAETAKVEDACRQADIVCTTTGSAEPLFCGSWLKDGAHVNAVGSYQPHTTELDVETVGRCRDLVIDTADAWEAGDLKFALEAGAVEKSQAITLGALCLGEKPQSKATGTISLFKSVGTAAQDMSTAALAFQDCSEQDLGSSVEF